MHRPRDVLELLLADVIAGKLDASVDLLVDLARDADPAGLGDALEARRYVDAVAGSVDDAARELADHRKDDRLVPLEIAHGARLVGAHQCAVAGDVGRENGGEPPFHALFGHCGRSLARRSSRADTYGQRVALVLDLRSPGQAGSLVP